MQNQSVLCSPSTPRRPQSVAALLPEEIVDSIFSQLGCDFSGDSRYQGRRERREILSNMSVVAEGWLKPARRLLFSKVRIQEWEHLQETVGEWAGKQVRRLQIQDDKLNAVKPAEIAQAIFELLKKLPNLRRLALTADHEQPFPPFDHVDVSSLSSAILLPHLSELDISDIALPHSVIFAFLATSNHHIRRLKVSTGTYKKHTVAGRKQLDFRGNLRCLSADEVFYQMLLDPTWVVLNGLDGLEELDLAYADGKSSSREGEFLQVVAPTLSTLTIDAKKAISWFQDFPHPFPRLSRLSIATNYANPPLFLRCLPPNLTSLHLYDDLRLQPDLARWTANPALVPASLKSIGIDNIRYVTTFQQLPPIHTLSTNYTHSAEINLLRLLSPGALPFKMLEMWFQTWDLGGQVSAMEAECSTAVSVMSGLVDIASISSASFGVGKHLTGQITSTKPFNSVTRLGCLQIKSLATPSTSSAAVAVASIDIQLKGNWAGEALARFATGQTVSISSEYAKVVAKPSSSGGNVGKSIYRIEFEGGIKGIVHTSVGDKESFEFVNPAIANKVVNQPARRFSPEGMSLDVGSGANATTTATKAKSPVEEKKTSKFDNRVIADEPPRKRSASATGIVPGAVEPAKKQEVEKAVAGISVSTKVDKEAKKEAQRAAQEKARAIAQETKPDGWPPHLSIAAVGTRGAGVGYNDCISFSTTTTFDFIGVVTLVVKAPSLIEGTKSGEWSTILRMVDTSAPEAFDLLFEFKRPGGEQAHLPNPKVGDVIVCRKIKYSMHTVTGPKVTGFPTQFSHLIFPSELLLDQSSKIPLSVVSRDKRVAGYNEADLDYARYLAKWANGKNLEKQAKEIARVVRAPVVKVGGTRRGRRMVTVAEMETGSFCNLIAEVVGCHYEHHNNVLQLSVTDYSVNEGLYDFDEGQEAAHDIIGKRLLTISCWDDIAGNDAAVAGFKEKGRIYRFDNVRAVHSRSEYLEGSISLQSNGDQRNDPITRLTVVPQDLIARRAAYFAERALDNVENEVKLAPVFDAPTAAPAVAAPMAVARGKTTIHDPLTAAENFGAQFDLFALPISKMVDLLQDKTEGRVYRIQGKIVDHSSVEDWVQAICPECFEIIASGFVHCEIHKKVQYVYRAALIIMAPPSIPELPLERMHLRAIIHQSCSDLVIPGLVPDEEMRRGEGRKFAQLKARFARVLGRPVGNATRDGPYFDMALRAKKMSNGEWLYQFEGTSFVEV